MTPDETKYLTPEELAWLQAYRELKSRLDKCEGYKDKGDRLSLYTEIAYIKENLLPIVNTP